jgi:hypothetical protein
MDGSRGNSAASLRIGNGVSRMGMHEPPNAGFAALNAVIWR